MRKRFIKMTSGWIPVSVMLLFAAALVVGQTRADLSPEAGTSPPVSSVSGAPGLLDPNDHARLASIRHFVDSVMPISEAVEMTIDASVYPVDDDFETGTGLLE